MSNYNMGIHNNLIMKFMPHWTNQVVELLYIRHMIISLIPHQQNTNNILRMGVLHHLSFYIFVLYSILLFHTFQVFYLHNSLTKDTHIHKLFSLRNLHLSNTLHMLKSKFEHMFLKILMQQQMHVQSIHQLSNVN